MDKVSLAYKLTADTIKKYSIDQLEDKYNCSGGELMAAVFSDVLCHLDLPLEDVDANHPETPIIIDDIADT